MSLKIKLTGPEKDIVSSLMDTRVSDDARKRFYLDQAISKVEALQVSCILENFITFHEECFDPVDLEDDADYQYALSAMTAFSFS